jgi:hypothetical protein
VEGLALIDDGAATYLIASSQGDSAFAVWRVDGAIPAYKGRFSVVANGGIDAVTGTDGVAALGGQVGAFPQGLVVMQDDVDDGATGARQNFKLVHWREVKKALGLKGPAALGSAPSAAHPGIRREERRAKGSVETNCALAGDGPSDVRHPGQPGVGHRARRDAVRQEQ